jgi:hypothetical protein
VTLNLVSVKPGLADPIVPDSYTPVHISLTLFSNPPAQNTYLIARRHALSYISLANVFCFHQQLIGGIIYEP